MAVIERKTKRSPTDLTDEEWAQAGGKLREVLNAIR